jgi:hypothetical protein
MTQRTGDGKGLLWRALAASAGLHLLLALFLPVWTMQVSGGLQPVEAVSFARILRVVVQRPAAQTLPAASQQTRHRSPQISFARVKSELAAPSHHPTVRPSVRAGPQGHLAAAPHRLAAHDAPPYAHPATPAQVTSVQAPAAPSPQPDVTLQPRPVAGAGASDRGGMLPFGADQPATLDPAVLAQLHKRFNVHVTLIVTVGDDGRTKDVQFEPPIDTQTENAIREVLASANWDAAVCGGGVSCISKAEINL